MDFRIEILLFKLDYTVKIMLFGLFGRELLCFEYLDISLDLPEICCCRDKISLQQQIPLMKPCMPGQDISHNLFVCLLLFILEALRCSLFTEIFCR